MTLNKLTAEEILKDDNASNWLKNSIRTAISSSEAFSSSKGYHYQYGRDLVDMITYAEVLVTVLKNEFNIRLKKDMERNVIKTND